MSDAVATAHQMLLEGHSPAEAAAAARGGCNDFGTAWALHGAWQKHVHRGLPDLPLDALLAGLPKEQVWTQGLAWLAKQRGSPGARAVALLHALRPLVREAPSPVDALTTMLLARDPGVRAAALGLGAAWAPLDPEAAQRLAMELLHGHKMPGVHASAAWIGSVAPRPQDLLGAFMERIPGVGIRSRFRLMARLLPASRVGGALAPAMQELHDTLPFTMHTFLAWLADAWQEVPGLEAVCLEILASDPADDLADLLVEAAEGRRGRAADVRRSVAAFRSDAAQDALLQILDEVDDDHDVVLPPWPAAKRIAVWRLRRHVRRDPYGAWGDTRAVLAAEPTLEARLSLALAWQIAFSGTPAPPPRRPTRNDLDLPPHQRPVLPMQMWGPMAFDEVRGDVPAQDMVPYAVAGIILGQPAKALAGSWLPRVLSAARDELQQCIVRAAKQADPASAMDILTAATGLWQRGSIRWSPIIFSSAIDMGRWLQECDRIVPALAARIRTRILRDDPDKWNAVAPYIGMSSLSGAELEAEVSVLLVCSSGWPERPAVLLARRIIDSDAIPDAIKKNMELGDGLLSRCVKALRDGGALGDLADEARSAGDDEALAMILPTMARRDPAMLAEAFDVLRRRAEAGHRVGSDLVTLGRDYIQRLERDDANRCFVELHRVATLRSSGAYAGWFYAVLTWRSGPVDDAVVEATRRQLGMD